MDGNIEWYMFSLSYLRAAQTLINRANERGAEVWRYAIPPIGHNFRHGLELFYKFLAKVAGNPSIKPLGHDISAILPMIHPVEPTEEQLAKVSKLLKHETETAVSLEELRKFYGESERRYEETWRKWAGDDSNNTAFRYPEIFTRIEADSENLVNELRLDIEGALNFEEIFLMFHSNIFDNEHNSSDHKP